MTLLDYPGRVAATVFTGGCNFRCPFCHNASLVTSLSEADEITETEVLAYLEKRRGLLDGVCITGGEPLLYPDIKDFMKKIKDMGYSLKLDTNGSYPERLRAVVEADLVDYVAMDIKNSKEKYGLTVGVENFDVSPIEESVNYLLSGKVDFEFRTTVVRELHTVSDIEKIALWIKGAPRYFLQNFTDSGNLIGEGLSAHEKEVLEEMQKIVTLHINDTKLRGI